MTDQTWTTVKVISGAGTAIQMILVQFREGREPDATFEVELTPERARQLMDDIDKILQAPPKPTS